MRHSVKTPIMAALMVGAGLFFGGCGEDRTYQYLEKTARCQWIHNVMSQWYLWNDEMPTMPENLFFGDPESFFKKLLVSKDKYSYMESADSYSGVAESRAIDLRSSYGMDFALYIDPVTQSQSSPERVARVLYVLPGSPADEAGIRRGQWITQIDSLHLSTTNYLGLISGPATTVGLAALNYSNPDSLYWEPVQLRRIAASRHLEDNPFFVDTLYHKGGRRVAYLMYNRFSTGPDDTGNETEYNSQMRQIFSHFKQQQATDLILDLRYNPGGYLHCAQVLASLIAPQSAMGKIFCKLEFNDVQASTHNETYLIDESLKDANLDLPRLYVITSSLTASASESIINGLRALMGEENVILIGSRTEGKNVASLSFESSYGFTLHPIVATVFNGNGESDYSNGFPPNVEVDELQSIYPFYPLGDLSELMLNMAMNTVLGTQSPEGETRAPSLPPTLSKPELTSINAKGEGGMKLPSSGIMHQ